MGISGAIVMGAGIVSGGIGKYGAAKANETIANKNAGFSEQAAQFSEYQAEDALKRGIEDENMLSRRIRQAVGTARASYAGQGIEVNDGSAADAQTGLRWAGEQDALTIRNNAAKEAWGFKTQAWGHRVEAWNYRVNADMQRSRATSSAFETVLGLAQLGYSSGMKVPGGGGGASSYAGNGGGAGNYNWGGGF